MLLKSIFPFFIGCLSLSLFAACQQTTEKSSPTFALYTLQKDDSNKILLAEELTANQPTQTITIPDDFHLTRELIQKDGFYYHQDAETKNIRKFQLTNNGLKLLGTIALGNYYIENACWINKSDTLLLTTIDSDNVDKAKIFIIDSKNFKTITEKQLPIPLSGDDFNILNIGLVEVSDQQLWLSYSYSRYIDQSDYSTSDEMHFMTLSFPDLSLISEQTDSRSSFPGGVNIVQSYSFKDEQGDLYFMACPGIALGNNPNKPTAIFRKQKGNNKVDTHYMIDISKKIENHAYGIWYLGNQEAIIRSERKDKYSDFSYHHSSYQFEYYRVNLQSQEFHKINVPLDKGTRKENVWIHQGKAYIGIDDANDKHCVWIYDSATDKVEKGLEIANNNDFILRIDALK